MVRKEHKMHVEMKFLFLEPQTFIKSLEQSYYRCN